MPNTMLKTSEEKQASETALFPKWGNCLTLSTSTGRRRYKLHEKDAEKIVTKRPEMKKEIGEIRKVVKKSKDIIVAEPQITAITGQRQNCPFRKSNL